MSTASTGHAHRIDRQVVYGFVFLALIVGIPLQMRALYKQRPYRDQVTR